MQPANAPRDDRAIFLLEQPLWRAVGKPADCWQLAMAEEEPVADGEEPARRPAPREGDKRKLDAEWKRIERAEVVQRAVSAAPEDRRVAIVCGAGLGKTTTLHYLQAAINARHNGFDPNLGFLLDLAELPGDRDRLLDLMVKKIKARIDAGEDSIRQALRRKLAAGCVTFLLDSLDQADPSPRGAVVQALAALMQGAWGGCRVWISGRPYAFETARAELEKMSKKLPWQFLRVGQLEEAECRYLLETSRPRRAP